MTSYRQRGKAPQALLRAASSPHCGEPFFGRRSRPQKASSRSGEVAEVTRPEGLLQSQPLPHGFLPKKFHHTELYPINRTAKRAKISPVRHCGQNAHNEFKNLCNFLNKTSLRNGVFFGTIKLCKSVYLELCPEQIWGACQAARDLCGPDNRTAL